MLSCIAAIGPNKEIGFNNDLIYSSEKDMKLFRKYTEGKTVLMGYKTWLSLPGPYLPNRTNVVVLKDNRPMPSDLSKAMKEHPQIRFLYESFLLSSMDMYKNSRKEYVIMGGGRLYEITSGRWNKIYLTEFKEPPKDADTFFPDFDHREYITIKYEGNEEFDFSILAK